MREILRIGKKAIVSFPNFGHISVRRQFMLNGTMPKSPAIPYEWYETPNIHMVTINDFESLCREKNYRIEKRLHFSIGAKGKGRRIAVARILFAQYGFFLMRGAVRGTTLFGEDFHAFLGHQYGMLPLGRERPVSRHCRPVIIERLVSYLPALIMGSIVKNHPRDQTHPRFLVP